MAIAATFASVPIGSFAAALPTLSNALPTALPALSTTCTVDSAMLPIALPTSLTALLIVDTTPPIIDPLAEYVLLYSVTHPYVPHLNLQQLETLRCLFF